MSVGELKQRLEEAEARASYYQSCVDSFFSGNIPDGASIQHAILAKYGRIRLENLKKTPILLQTEQ